jgi:hypothetical protein
MAWSSEGRSRETPISERCLLARKACLHGHHSRLQRHARRSHPYIGRVHPSSQCLQGYKRHGRTYIRRLQRYTGVGPLYIGVLRANKHRWWTSKHRWWTGITSHFPISTDLSAVCRGFTAASSGGRRAIQRCTADDSRWFSHSHLSKNGAVPYLRSILSACLQMD